MSRGYRTSPYPSAEIRQYILARGGKLLLSSDAHAKENIAYGFDTVAGREGFLQSWGEIYDHHLEAETEAVAEWIRKQLSGE
jgi:hypothetical protein